MVILRYFTNQQPHKPTYLTMKSIELLRSQKLKMNLHKTKAKLRIFGAESRLMFSRDIPIPVIALNCSYQSQAANNIIVFI